MLLVHCDEYCVHTAAASWASTDIEQSWSNEHCPASAWLHVCSAGCRPSQCQLSCCCRSAAVCRHMSTDSQSFSACSTEESLGYTAATIWCIQATGCMTYLTFCVLCVCHVHTGIMRSQFQFLVTLSVPQNLNRFYWCSHLWFWLLLLLYFYALVLHSQGLKISKSKNVCPEWLRWGLGNCERVGKAHSIETLNCHWNTLVQERSFPQIGCEKHSMTLLRNKY